MIEPRPLERRQPKPESFISEETTSERPAAFVDKLSTQLFPDGGDAATVGRDFLLKGAHSPETQAAQEEVSKRAEERGVRIVGTYESKSVAVGRGEPSQHLVTHKLNGCVATVVFTNFKDGRREAAMTHFPDFMRERNRGGLERVAKPAGEVEARRAMIYMEDKRIGGKGDHESMVKSVFGEDVPVETIPYHTDPTKEDNGMLVVEVSPRGIAPKVHSWEGSKQLK